MVMAVTVDVADDDEDDADGGDGVDLCCVLLLVVRMHGVHLLVRDEDDHGDDGVDLVVCDEDDHGDDGVDLVVCCVLCVVVVVVEDGVTMMMRG